MYGDDGTWEEQDDIDDIERTLEEAGVSSIDADDDVNISMAEYEGWPPKKHGVDLDSYDEEEEEEEDDL